MKIKIVSKLFLMVSILLSILISSTSMAANISALDIDTGTVKYWNNYSIDIPNADLQQAVIVIHGMNRNADDYYSYIEQAAKTENIFEQTLILAPQFKAIDDTPQNNELYWSASGWKKGFKAKNGNRTPSFQVIDTLLDKINTNFPNIKYITLVGHSAGGQFVQRYAALSEQESTLRSDLNIRYIVANPSSYLYLNSERPQTTLNCDGYDLYHYGIANLPSSLSYTKLDASSIQNQLTSRSVFLLLGTADNNPNSSSLDTSCKANAQGFNRYQRGSAYYEHIKQFNPNAQHTKVDVEGIGHSANKMFNSISGRNTIFYTESNTVATNLTPTTSDNYLDNAGAEAGIQSWTTFGGGADLQSSTAQAHTGTHSFLSARRTAFYHGPNSDIKPLIDSGKLLNGQRYTASVWVYHTEATAKKLNLNIKKVDSAGTDYRHLEGELVAPNQWVKIVKHFVVDVDNSLQNLDIYVISDSGETFDFYSDDFTLSELENYTPPSSSQATDFIKASGKELVVGTSNTPIILQGINITVPTDADTTVEDIWDVKSVSLKDFQNIKRIGFNAIRLHMNYKTFEDDNNIGHFKTDGWHWLDRAIGYAKATGIYVLLDMHAAQGGYQSDKAPGFSAFWDTSGELPNTSNQERLLNLWEAIAARYQHETTVLGYDLLNEPRPNDSEEWLSYAEQIIEKIRSQDSQHLIVLEVPFINNYTMRTVNDSNVLYDSHTYAIWGYSIQYSAHYGTAGQRWGQYNPSNPLYVDPSWNVAWTPDEGGTPPANSQAFNKDFLEKVLVDDILEFANNYNVPVNVGEYGSVRETFTNNVGALDLIRDTRNIFAGDNRYAMKLSSFYFTYQSTVFGLYGNWNGFQVDDSSFNTALAALFSTGTTTSGTDNVDSNSTDTTATDDTSSTDTTATDDTSSNTNNTDNANTNDANNTSDVTNNDDSNTVVADNTSTNLRLTFEWGNYPSTPVIGRAHKFKARIYNESEVVAQATELKIELPNGATLHKGKNCTVSDDSNYVICNIGDISANRRRTKTVYLILNEGGDIAVNAEVSSAIDDIDVSNNRVTSRLTVSDAADLSVKIQKKGKARVSKALSIKIVTRNKGAAPAKNVDTVFPIPSNAEFISASSACNFNADWDEVKCTWDRLDNNARRTVYIYIRPLDLETMTISAATESDNNDPQPSNNAMEKSFQVN